jgi:hypothetical protein
MISGLFLFGYEVICSIRNSRRTNEPRTSQPNNTRPRNPAHRPPFMSELEDPIQAVNILDETNYIPHLAHAEYISVEKPILAHAVVIETGYIPSAPPEETKLKNELTPSAPPEETNSVIKDFVRFSPFAKGVHADYINSYEEGLAIAISSPNASMGIYFINSGKVDDIEILTKYLDIVNTYINGNKKRGSNVLRRKIRTHLENRIRKLLEEQSA